MNEPPEPKDQEPQIAPNALGADNESEPNALAENVVLSHECSQINCLQCGKEFLQSRHWQKFCCTEHRNQFYWKDKKRATIRKLPVEISPDINQPQPNAD